MPAPKPLSLDLFSASDIERFHNSYDKRGVDDCWEWRLRDLRDGYGRFVTGHPRYGTRSRHPAHRLAYLLATNTDPGDLLVCHRCDNPRCCNPGHLFLGTHDENMLDRSRKLRVPHVVGHRKFDATTAAEVLADTRSKRQIALHFGMSVSNVAHIKSRRTWNHSGKSVTVVNKPNYKSPR